MNGSQSFCEMLLLPVRGSPFWDRVFSPLDSLFLRGRLLDRVEFYFAVPSVPLCTLTPYVVQYTSLPFFKSRLRLPFVLSAPYPIG